MNETPEAWDSVLATQLNAVFLLSRIAAKGMLSRKKGKIINIGSMYSFFWFWSHTFVQCRKRCDYPTHEIHGN
jgi:NAD(P)-dependent dehydrogenase (short-subunit alcohol dehydrogenase family)